ncbi:YhcN/YlaJ family sporulation lipoprotein, partial [Leptospira santarosai]|nr:YhcN/YlaJ family sporulation lipoprotein [Leptospira santarosai]
MKKTWIIFSNILLCTALMGCGTKEDKETTNNSAPIEENTDETANDEVNLELADKASEKIAELEEVESATVILTDNNAYVGVVLNKKADGTEIKEGSEELDELYAKIRKELSMTNADV